MWIVDAHLDLSYNALNGRDVLRPAAEQPANADGIATVGLPDLKAGNVRLICATIFCQPASDKQAGYRSPEEARRMALQHLDWYRRMADERHLRLIRNRADLLCSQDDSRQQIILLLEGADSLRDAADVEEFHTRGVRIVGLAWKRTRHAGGTGEPGPLTPEGRQLLPVLDRFGIIHDLSHLAEESFWNLLDLSGGPVMASHSNCRAIVPTDRHLSDDMIRAAARRGAVLGINFFDRFLQPPSELGTRRATLADVVRHIRHMCDLIGDARHVGLGTDMDGGLGRDEVPVEIRTSRDLPRLADALSASGFDDNAVRCIMSDNWMQFFEGALPA